MKQTLQIILVGWEFDRLMYGLKQFPPKKAIFVTSSPKASIKKEWSDVTTEITNQAIRKIKYLIDTEIVYVNYHNFEDCISKMIDILESNMNHFDEILINVSSASKPLVIAAVLASQYYPVKLFYVIPKEYNKPTNTKFLSKGAMGIIELPTFELKDMVLPTKKQKEILLEVEYKKISFSNLIEEYSKKHDIKLDDYKFKKMKSLFFYHLKKLENKRLIKLNVEHGELFISLTETGKFIYKVIERSKNSHQKLD